MLGNQKIVEAREIKGCMVDVNSTKLTLMVQN